MFSVSRYLLLDKWWHGMNLLKTFSSDETQINHHITKSKNLRCGKTKIAFFDLDNFIPKERTLSGVDCATRGYRNVLYHLHGVYKFFAAFSWDTKFLRDNRGIVMNIYMACSSTSAKSCFHWSYIARRTQGAEFCFFFLHFSTFLCTAP